MNTLKQKISKSFILFSITCLSTTLTMTPSFADTLTISIWGGGYGNMWKKHAAEPFEKKTGHKVIIDGGSSSQRLSKLIATKGRGIDLIFLTDYQMAIANEKGLLTTVNPSNVKSMSQLYDFAKDPLGGGLCPAITVIGAGLAFNKSHFSKPPTSWNALFSKDLKGNPGYPSITQSYSPLVLIRIAEMYGGGINAMDNGFNKLAEIKDSVQIFKLFEILDAINQGDASVSPMLNIFVRKDPSVPLSFSWPKDGGIGVLNLACIIKGTKKKELAEQFLDFYLSAENQSHLAKSGGDSPVNKTVQVPKGTKYNMVTETQVSKLHFYDATIIVAKRDGWLTRFQEEIIAE